MAEITKASASCFTGGRLIEGRNKGGKEKEQIKKRIQIIHSKIMVAATRELSQYEQLISAKDTTYPQGHLSTKEGNKECEVFPLLSQLQGHACCHGLLPHYIGIRHCSKVKSRTCLPRPPAPHSLREPHTATLYLQEHNDLLMMIKKNILYKNTSVPNLFPPVPHSISSSCNLSLFTSFLFHIGVISKPCSGN